MSLIVASKTGSFTVNNALCRSDSLGCLKAAIRYLPLATLPLPFYDTPSFGANAQAKSKPASSRRRSANNLHAARKR